MKKTTALILALVMCLSLCACGGNKSGNGQNDPAVYIGGMPDTVGDKIEFDNLVLAETEQVKIMLVDFYVDKLFASGNSDGAKCATFKIENKTEHEMSVWVTPYLDNEALGTVGVEGSTTVEAGRIGRQGYTFTYGEFPNCTDLESLEDLYDLEFTFDLRDLSTFDDYKVNCSVADAMSGNNGVAADSESPMAENFSIRNDVHFGDSMDEVAAKEQRWEVDYESAGEGGYISAQAMDSGRETTTFDGGEDAYLFYYFDAENMGLEQVFVMFGHGSDRLSMLNTYEGFLKLYFERYGIQLTDDQMQYIPIDTIAYEYATTHYEDSQMEKHNRWLLSDGDGYVIIDVTTSLIFGDSYYTFVGMRHVTAEEITAAGGNLSAINQ